MKTFEIQAPDGRVLRQVHPAQPPASSLMPGYVVVGEVFGADSKGNGGMVDRYDSAPLLVALLDGRNGAFLEEWLTKRAAVHEASAKAAKGKAA